MMLAFYMAGFVAIRSGAASPTTTAASSWCCAPRRHGLLHALVPFAATPLWFAFLFVMIGFFNGFVPAGMALLVANTPPGRIGSALSLAQSGAIVGHTHGPGGGQHAGGAGRPAAPSFLDQRRADVRRRAAGALFVHEVKQLAPGPWRPQWIGGLRQIAALPRMTPLYLLSMVFAMLWHGSMPVITIYMLRLLERHPSGAEAYWVGAAALGLGVASVIALPFWGRALDRYGPSRVLAVSVAASAATHLPLLVLDTPLALVLARVRVRAVRGRDAARHSAADAHPRAQGHGCARDLVLHLVPVPCDGPCAVRGGPDRSRVSDCAPTSRSTS